jgi:heptosyltransferase I
MDLPFTTPPASLCVLRLSALGDICHALPIVRTIQRAWPQTRLTWIIGKSEHALVQDIPDIEFVPLDKSAGFGGYAALRRQLRGRRFDALLHMQMSLRASAASRCVSTPIRLGFDRARAKDFQWLFTNRRIAPRKCEHVVDSLFGFTEALGIRERVLRWDIPIPLEAAAFAETVLGTAAPTLVISPCSSVSYRNWNAEGYAAVADHAAQRHGLRVVITGGRSVVERRLADAIVQRAQCRPLDLVGCTNLKQLLALLRRAVLVVAPDSGPAHMATAVGTPVVGLYACTNPERARPYLSADYVVNKYPEAVQQKYRRPVAALPWGTRVRDASAMNLITGADVTAVLDKALSKR